MPEDFLAEWKRRTGTAQPVAREASPQLAMGGGMDAQSGEDDEESPTRYRMERIELRPLRGLWSMPSYAQLLDVLFDGKNPSFLALVFVDLLVIVKGRNLKFIVAGLRMRTQWIIEQYDEARNGPAGAGKPVIESMEFITDNIGQAVAALRHEKTARAS